MRAAKAIIGGEGNGGVMLPALHLGRDAPVGAILILDLMARTRRSVADLVAAQPNYSIVKAKTGRDPGTENNRSQDRKGIIGDHKNHFTREAAEIFNHYAGHLLKRLGYEKDDSWIDRFS